MEPYHPHHDNPNVLSPNSIRPPPSSHCAFSPAWKISTQLLKILLFQFFKLFKKFSKPEIAYLKLRNPGCVYAHFIWPAPIKTIYILWLLCQSSAVNH
jgi:hypothetical protein